MHRTSEITTVARSPRTVIAVVGVALAATTAGILAFAGPPDAHADPANSAYGISASGVDTVGPQPSVSSDSAVKSTAADTVRGPSGTFVASGLSVKAGAGMAEATVANLAVGGRSVGSVNVKCANGVSMVSHSGSPVNEPNFRVGYGAGGGPTATGATITIAGADGQPSQTITVAVVSCGKGTPPTTQPTPPSTGTSTGKTTETNTPRPAPQEPDVPEIQAPKPSPAPGHHPVTG